MLYTVKSNVTKPFCYDDCMTILSGDNCSDNRLILTLTLAPTLTISLFPTQTLPQIPKQIISLSPHALLLWFGAGLELGMRIVLGLGLRLGLGLGLACCRNNCRHLFVFIDISTPERLLPEQI